MLRSSKQGKPNYIPYRWLPDLAVAGILILMGWVYTGNVAQMFDVGLYDETYYLQSGLKVPDGLPGGENAPVYALWYYLLSLLQSDPVHLYYLNYQLMTILPSVMLFLALRAYRLSPLIAFCCAAGLLFASFNLFTWPRVSHFAVTLLLGGFGLAANFKDRRWRAVVLSAATLAACYVRPELFLAFGLSAIVLMLAVCADRRLEVKSVLPVAALVVSGLLMIAGFGMPIGSGNRGMLAFGQHYARNWVVHHHDDRDPWTNWETIIEAEFGDAQSVRQALKANPAAVARHVAWNMRSFHSALASMFATNSVSDRRAALAFRWSLLFIALAAVSRLRRDAFSRAAGHLVANARQLWIEVSYGLILLVPIVLAILVMAPRRHYMFMFVVLAGLIYSLLFFHATEKHGGHSSVAILAMFCLAGISAAAPLARYRPAMPQPNLSLIHAIRELNVRLPVRILEADGGYHVYLGDHFSIVPGCSRDPQVALADFLEQQSVNMIVVSDRLNRDVRFRDDPDWQAFIANPAGLEFEELEVKAPDRRLFIHAEINDRIVNQGVIAGP